VSVYREVVAREEYVSPNMPILFSEEFTITECMRGWRCGPLELKGLGKEDLGKSDGFQ
jgi:hypothetical protein